MCAPLQTEVPRVSMAFGNPELAGSIQRRFVAMESQELWGLVEMLACESTIHSQRLRSILQSPIRMENLIGYINTLSAQQKKLLIGRVALSLLRKICAFMEDDDNGHPKSHLVNNAPGNFHHGTIKISSWNENFEPESPKSHLGNGASELCHIDAALVLLIVAEAHEHECNGMNISARRYVCENILKMGYSVPGLMVDEVGLRSSIDLLCRYERLLGAFMSLSPPPPPPPPPPASAATILSLPSAIYTGGGVVCSICGDALKSRLSVASCLPCSHVYHWECIHSWLKARNTCPLCRHELPTDDVIYEVARHIRRIFC